jgi:hypothetical protein
MLDEKANCREPVKERLEAMKEREREREREMC